MKKHLLMLSALLCLGFQATAEDMNGSVTVASDYNWRGLSFTSNGPVVQGDMSYMLPMNVKLGVWGSNVGSLDSATSPTFGGYAMNPYVTYTHEMGDMAFYGTFMWHTFTKMADRNSTEFTLGMNWKDLNVGISYIPDFFNVETAAPDSKSTSNMYIQANYAHHCKDMMWFVVHAGHSTFSEAKAFSTAYTDAKLGAQLRKDKMTMEMAYSMTMGRETDASPASKFKDSAFIVGATWNM